MKHYDVLIIGSGGGTKLRPAASLGKRVAIIEKDDLGGTCLNRGCIPSKMLIYPSDLMRHMEQLPKHQIEPHANPVVDFAALTRRVTQTVHADSEGIAVGYGRNPNVDLYRGHGRFVSDKVVEVNGEQLSADRIYIATGSRPMIPDIEGLADTPYWDSTDALRATTLPRKMIIIGTGYIGTELGHFYASMGTETHYLVRNGILRQVDTDLRNEFVQAFSKHHHLHMDATPTAVSHADDEFTVTYTQDGETHEITADALLVVTGVIPNSDDLGLQNTGIQTDNRGYIQVNDHLETDVENVYALGDVVGNYLFRHSVNFEGEYLFGQHFANHNPAPIKYPPMPYAVFTYPQMAGVGLTEAELREQGVDILVTDNNYRASAMGMAMQSEYGLVKLIFERQTGVLIAAHILGEKASDIVHMLVLAATHRMTAEQLLDMIYIHPALSEVIRNACRKAVAQLS